MSNRNILSIVTLILFAITSLRTVCVANQTIDHSPTLQATFFAQTHIKEPTEDYFFLTSDRDVLVRAYVISPTGIVPNVSLEVTSSLFHSGQTNTINMTAPGSIPTSNVNLAYGQRDHSLDNAFLATIPKDWVKVDTEVSILIDGIVVNTFLSGALNVMSSNPLKFFLFDIHAFALGNRSQDPNSLIEMGEKLPVSDFDVEHVQDIVFPEVSIAPNGSTPAMRVSSIAEYNTSCGCTFNAHNSNSILWRNALRIAAGAWYGYTCYTSLGWYFDGSNAIKGQGGSSALGFGDVHTIDAKLFIHEVGHGLSLPHWNNPPYPYFGDMHGIPKPDASDFHVGPVWGYYAPTSYPIPPIVQPNPVGGGNTPGNYKQDPMRGGGSGDQEAGFVYRHFSDYSANDIADEIQNKPLVVWNDSAQNYRNWDPATGTYSGGTHNNEGGIEYPIERDIDVYSLLFAVSSTTPQANLIYPPIGPYESGVINTFDPTTSDVGSADALTFCNFSQGIHNYSGCDYTAKVTQGGTDKYYMLRADTGGDNFDVFAMNLKADDGIVTRIELLDTPNVHTNGLPANPTVLTTWDKPFIDAYLELDDITLLHNPSDNVYEIEGDLGNFNIDILDSTGMVYQNISNTGNRVEIDITTLPTGLYFIRIVNSANNIVSMEKILKMN